MLLGIVSLLKKLFTCQDSETSTQQEAPESEIQKEISESPPVQQVYDLVRLNKDGSKAEISFCFHGQEKTVVLQSTSIAVIHGNCYEVIFHKMILADTQEVDSAVIIYDCGIVLLSGSKITDCQSK